MNLLKNKMGMRVLTLALCAALGGSVLAVKAESVAGETVVQEAVQDENMSENREIAHPAQEAEAYKQADPKFAKLIEAGERYIGYPYVWGGDSPETSFDCSGFISWIFKESGVRDVGRLGATSLYGVCTPIEPEEARPGDLIFFQGTLGDGVAGNDGITHVALYVGDGYILNCGNPISYADLSRAYWQEHFYGFGRIYE